MHDRKQHSNLTRKKNLLNIFGMVCRLFIESTNISRMWYRINTNSINTITRIHIILLLLLLLLLILLLLLFLTPVLSSQGIKKLQYAIQKVQKSSWNEPYSSSSFAKQNCHVTVRWHCTTESKWRVNEIKSWFLCHHRPIRKLATELERKTRPDSLIGPNDSTALGCNVWCVWMFEYFTDLTSFTGSCCNVWVGQ